LNPVARRVFGVFGLLAGVALLLRSVSSDDPNRAIHIIAGISLVLTGCGLIMGLGGKDEDLK
jgi:hypothetical protein